MTMLRFHLEEIPFPRRFPFYLGGNENRRFVSDSVSVRFQFHAYRCATGNEQPTQRGGNRYFLPGAPCGASEQRRVSLATEKKSVSFRHIHNRQLTIL